MRNKKYFFLTTNGHTASKWIAGILSMHPDIYCTHGPASIAYSTIHHREYTDEEIKILMQEETRKETPIDNLLEEIEIHFPNKKVIGNIHLFNLRQFNDNITKNKTQKAPVVIDIVRHPISSIQSGFYNIYRQSEYNPERAKYLLNIKSLNTDLFEKYSVNYGLDLNNNKTLSFMANIMTLKSFQINFSLDQYNHRFKMEDLTTSKESLKKIIKIISDDSIEVNDDYLDAVYKSQKSNAHDIAKINKNEREKYKLWENWQKQMFKEVLKQTNCKYYFEEMGYDLSFVV